MNIALISPNKIAYSETFIQQHRNHIKGNVVYYFNGKIPIENDLGYNFNSLRNSNVFLGLLHKIKLLKFSPKEYQFYKSLKINKIDVVVAEYGSTGAVILNICKSKNIPIIPIFHGFEISKTKLISFYRERYVELVAYSKKTIAVSNKIKETLVNLGADANKIIVTPCAASPKFQAIKPNYDNQHFLAIGRFVDKKAPYYLILAFRNVVKQFPDAKLTICGDGHLHYACFNLIKSFDLQDSIKLPGKVTSSEIRDYMEKSIAFVQHSIETDTGDSEGTPVSIMEASLAGLTVISTFHAGIPDVIKNNETGFLVEEHDFNLMSEKMCFLIKNKNIGIEMGAKGKENISENFSLDIHIESINRVIYGE